MRESFKTGVSFGSTSGIITTLGLMVGLHAGTHSRLAVMGGILTIAIADAFSDALGIHVSEEAENKHTTREIWESTIFTFLAKFFFAVTFLIPIFIFPLWTAIIVSVVYGMALLVLFSYYMARMAGSNPLPVVAEHLTVGLTVVLLTHYVGDWVSLVFKS
ncbi:hypothetical protein A2625_06765 [candidate division WOR-1 bacterium RIFCSPHIGHO2_01_FULL_53_15]|uniref:VIT family protein n=1 Tax=candidate division WOR-1 bacterium RIFCSPHIGHO2_01_FULL_53_15 TaxID=1802564 RepID=A0A1F4Q4U0_UNCSA|nr:MAG: hypothetical protein A2625_06765 [candidate division WOR-1 bacterium RIFCSPHIGHO2_01_FULL_53_15]OGC10306.1 MAG: hypothetical protein A3D23_06770 [candidate division WOR-1 bacterium RIFCSPHIGHO2_02_FULL_53_26]